MPKRKAPDEATTTNTPGAEDVTVSTNPRKKKKNNESIDPAKDQHYGDVASGQGSNHVGTVLHRHRHSGDDGGTTPKAVTASDAGHSRVASTKLTRKCNEGNSFLQRTRREKAPRPKDGPTPGSAEASNSSSTISEDVDYSSNYIISPGKPAKKQCIYEGNIIVARTLALLCLLSLNMAAVRISQQSFDISLQSKHHATSVEIIKKDILKSNEMEEILQSGIHVLEQQTRARKGHYLAEAVISVYDAEHFVNNVDL